MLDMSRLASLPALDSRLLAFTESGAWTECIAVFNFQGTYEAVDNHTSSRRIPNWKGYPREISNLRSAPNPKPVWSICIRFPIIRLVHLLISLRILQKMILCISGSVISVMM